MRKLIPLFLALSLTQAHADSKGVVTGTTTEGFSAPENIAYNGGFELSSGTAGSGWTASGGTFAISTSSPLRGSKSATWDASATSQTLSSKLVAIPSGMLGVGALASCQIKVASGTATHTFSVTDGTNTLGTATVVSSSIPAVTSIPFQMPTSGSVRIVLTSNADEPSIQVDDCFLGLNRIDQVSQATVYATAQMFGGTSCIFGESTSTSTTNYVDFNSTSTTCGAWTTSGNISVTQNDYRPTINNMPPGEYEIVMLGRYNHNAAGASQLRLSDGTNVSSPLSLYAQADIGVPVAIWRMRFETAGTRTFKLQCADTFTGSCEVAVNGTSASLMWVFKRFPLQTEQVVRADVLSGLWGSRYFPDGTAGFSTTSASYVSVTAANLFGTTTNKGAAVACTDANAVCIKIPQLLPGSYKIDYSGSIGINTGGSACGFAISDGSSDYETGGGYFGASIMSYAGGTVISYDSVQTNKEFTLRAKRISGSGTCEIITTYNVGHNLTITPLSQQLPVPVYVGSVTSQSSGVERVERVNMSSICAASPCTVDYKTPGITNVTRSATGNYSVNFASGTFSDVPTCTALGNRLTTTNGTATSSAFPVNTVDSTGANQNSMLYVTCIGPR